MPIKLEEVTGQVDPKRTVLLFGAGSSIPSGAPTSDALRERFATTFGLPREGFRLSELASLAEKKASRHKVIAELRLAFRDLKPRGGLLSLPEYDWKSIHTTNYDTLIEHAYALHSKQCRVYSSNFDFTLADSDPDCLLFKLHGTIEKDICDGNQSRIILSEADYEQTEPYREYLYDRLKTDLAGADLIIVGQSLADPDLNSLVRRAIALNAKILSPSRLTLLLYTEDEHRASLFEQKGLSIAFGGVDEFFAALAKTTAAPQATLELGDPMDRAVRVGVATLDVAEESDITRADISAMFNGWPATYSDIEAGLTFERNVAKEISAFFEIENSLCAVVVGAAGVGKSTAARQSLQFMRRAGFRCWEHKRDHPLDVDAWRKTAAQLKSERFLGALLVDDAHAHLHTLNDLIDLLVSDDNPHLKIIVASTKSNWYPRIKTPNIYKYGQEFKLSRLTADEMERLLNLIERQASVRALVEDTFSGFSRQERRRRLTDRCEADMFVCLKNIFASEAFDDIILREYAELKDDDQKIYKHVAAMETAGVRVHRQLVIRLLGIMADAVPTILKNLSDIVDEYTVNDKLGVYGWRCRHQVISGIVTKYKFKDLDQTIELFERIIDNISPTYDIEIMTIRELCNLETGLPRIGDKSVQNRLLRKMISIAPGERVPRHRLIRNLIDQGAFDKAETEIRVFNKDFGADGPVHRYKIRLMTARAVRAPGILEEDRIAILEQARELAVVGVERFPNNKNILAAYAELGIEFFKRTGSYDYFDEAVTALKEAHERLGDPDINTIIARFVRRIAGQAVEVEDDAQPVVDS